MRTRLGVAGKMSGWYLPRSYEQPQMRRYMKRIARRARRANNNEVIREALQAA